MSEIRFATLQDQKEITHIETVCFPPQEAADETRIRQRLETFPNHFYVATEGNLVVGFINGLVSDSAVLFDEMYDNAGLHEENGAYQMILSLAVSPAHQHRGYGTLLIQQMLESARQQGRKGVTLACREALIPFYTRCGFVSQGRSESVHGGFRWYEMRVIF